MPSLNSLANPIYNAGQVTGERVPLWVQLPLIFLLTPVWAASWLQAMINIPVIGVFVPWFVAAEITGSVRGAFAGAILWHAFIYSFIAFSAGWMRGTKKHPCKKWWIGLVPVSWIAILGGAFVGWLI